VTDLLPAAAADDRELKRMAYRIALFQRRGIDEGYAYQLADRLLERDRERDDLRYCLECRHLQRNGGCFQAAQGLMRGFTRDFKPIPDLFQRCSGFAWQTPA
jgi:hypothetical protein